jgi:hypothetical protein
VLEHERLERRLVRVRQRRRRDEVTEPPPPLVRRQPQRTRAGRLHPLPPDPLRVARDEDESLEAYIPQGVRALLVTPLTLAAAMRATVVLAVGA